MDVLLQMTGCVRWKDRLNSVRVYRESINARRLMESLKELPETAMSFSGVYG